MASSTDKQAWAFRASEPLSREIKKYADENNMSQSDALRGLVRSGLDAEEIRERMEEMEQRIDELDAQLDEDGSGGWWPPF